VEQTVKGKLELEASALPAISSSGGSSLWGRPEGRS